MREIEVALGRAAVARGVPRVRAATKTEPNPDLESYDVILVADRFTSVVTSASSSPS